MNIKNTWSVSNLPNSVIKRCSMCNSEMTLFLRSKPGIATKYCGEECSKKARKINEKNARKNIMNNKVTKTWLKEKLVYKDKKYTSQQFNCLTDSFISLLMSYHQLNSLIWRCSNEKCQ